MRVQQYPGCFSREPHLTALSKSNVGRRLVFVASASFGSRRKKKTKERDFRFWPSEKCNESQKMKEGDGEGKERNPYVSSHPLPALLLAPVFARSLTLVPRSLLRNCT